MRNKKDDKIKKKGVLKECVKLGEIPMNAKFYVGLILTEKDEANNKIEKTSFVASRAGYGSQQLVDNKSVALKKMVALEAVNVLAKGKYEAGDNIIYELVFKNKHGKLRSMFIDTFNNIVNPDLRTEYSKVFVNALVIKVNDETWVDSLDYYIDLYGECGTVYPAIFNIDGEAGVVIDEYKYNLLQL